MHNMLRAGGLAALLTFGLAPAASALEGYVSVDLNLRAGPNTDYPAVTVIPVGAPITVYGCLEGYGWCDVGYGAYRGWSYGDYLEIVSGGQRVYVVEAPPPIISFSFGTYWDRYYVDRPFYRERNRYRELRQEIRQFRRQERREDRRERREDQRERREDQRERREDRQERIEDRRDNRQQQQQQNRQERRQEQRQERRQEQRQERRQEQRQETRQERRQETRQERRQEQRQQRRNNRNQEEACPPGQTCQ